MDSYFALTIVKLLLKNDGHVSYKTLDHQLGISGEMLAELKRELIDIAGSARDEQNKGLVWTGDMSASSTVATAPDETAANKSPALANGTNPRQADAERRQLTVMFCDLVGSTALSTELDPEDLRDVLTAFQDKCREAIQRYGGFIARYMGDGMLVYFCYPQAHENEAERAARAGLDIVESMADLNAEVAAAHDIVLAVRVGVATGPVVVGDLIGEGAAEEAAVVGETPNRAARLQGIAEPNQLVIGPETHHIIRDLFSFDDLGQHALKGISKPTRAWRVTGVADLDNHHETARHFSSSPLVGRQEELGLLTRAWQSAKEGRGQVVLVQGEPGVGKSRLLEALREPLSDDEYAWVSIRCSPYYANTPLYPIVEHLKRVMRWRAEDTAQERWQKLEAALQSQSTPLPEVVPLIADLMSMTMSDDRYPRAEMTTQQRRDATLDVIVSWMLELCEAKPVLQVWEDLHWADPSTLELLGLYVEQAPTAATLSVLTYRPEFTQPWSMRSHMTPITLSRLERSQVETFVSNLSCGKSLPNEVLEHIVSKADGVPLYVEELTKTILDSGVLRKQGGQLLLDGTLAEMQIPSTLQDSLMARLDRTPTLREVAQRGAVLGREFAYEMLTALTALEELVVRSALDQLVDDEVLYQRGRGHHTRYIFKHALIQDIAYQSLLKRTRQHVHQQVAELLEAQFSEVVQTQPELLAHHYTEADIAESAVRYWAIAGELAQGKSANHEAIARVNKGLLLLGDLADSNDTAQLELKLQILLGHALIVVEGHNAPRVGTAFARANDLCQQLGDVPELLLVVLGLWRFNVATRSLKETQTVALQLERLAEQRQDTETQVLASYALGVTSLFLGHPRVAHQHFESALADYTTSQRTNDFYRAGQDPGVACQVYDSLVLWLRGFPDQARSRFYEGVALAKELDDDFSRAFALCWIGSILLAERGDWSELGALSSEGVELATEQGFSGWMKFGNWMADWATFNVSGAESALTSLSESIETTMKNTGTELISLPYCRVLEARAYHRLGHSKDAHRVLDEATKSANLRSEHWWLAEFERLRGEFSLSLSCENSDEAAKHYERALKIAREQEAKSLELRSAMSLAYLWADQGERERAIDLLAPVYNWFTEGFDTADLTEARSLLLKLEPGNPDSIAG